LYCIELQVKKKTIYSFSFSWSFATKFSPNTSNHSRDTQTFSLQIDSYH
jgi:hypothetical protein